MNTLRRQSRLLAGFVSMLSLIALPGAHAQSASQGVSYYLVDGGEAYTGEVLRFNGRRYTLSLDGQSSEGLLYGYRGLTVLWSGDRATSYFIRVTDRNPNSLASCWSTDPEAARNCSGDAKRIKLFRDLALAAAENESVEEPAPAEPSPAPAEPAPAEPPQPQPAEPEPAEPTPAPSTPEPSGSINLANVTCTASPAQLKAAILQATNASRASPQRCGSVSKPAVGALRWSDKLALAATRHSRDMASNNFFSHTGSDGQNIGSRARAADYQYRRVGENIAAGYRNVQSVHEGWMDSPGHCNNIMQPEVVEIGAACISDSGSDYRDYWTVVVGREQ